MRRMTALVLASNRNMVGIHRRLGVPVEGTLREHVQRADATTTDVITYGVLRDEWPTIRATAATLLPSSVRQGLAEVLDRFGAPAGHDPLR
jgi:hypothetical protein